MAKKPKPLTESEVVALLRAKAQRWVYLPNITSVGVGYKVKGGKTTNELSIQVTVKEKLQAPALAKKSFTPLPKRVVAPDGRSVPVDVVARDYRLSFDVTQPTLGSAFENPIFTDSRTTRISRLARVMPGISVSNYNGKAGTIGAIVYDNRSGIPCILSNAHVLSGFGPLPDDRVVQPGLNDDVDADRNLLGSVLRHHTGLAGDCAVAAIERRLFDEAIFELDVIPRRIAKVAVNDRVVKSGRKTGVTRGIVVRVGVVVPFNYPPPVGLQLIGGFEIAPDPTAPPPVPDEVIADGGDSGALWLIHDAGATSDIAAGLHFAAEFNPEVGTVHALACNIHSVLDQMDVSLAPRH